MEPYTGPIGVLALGAVLFCQWPLVSLRPTYRALQMIAILAVTWNIKTQYTDKGSWKTGDTTSGVLWGGAKICVFSGLNWTNFLSPQGNVSNIPSWGEWVRLNKRYKLISILVRVLPRKSCMAGVYYVHCTIVCLALNSRIY